MLVIKLKSGTEIQATMPTDTERSFIDLLGWFVHMRMTEKVFRIKQGEQRTTFAVGDVQLYTREVVDGNP